MKTLDILDSCDARAFLVTTEFDFDNGTVEAMDALVFASKANSEDNPTWQEAMNGPNRQGYWEACEKEFSTLEEKDSWEVVDRQPFMNVLPSTWAFKCK
jgi:hypothetical protein